MGQVKKAKGAHSPKMGAFGLSGGTGAAAPQPAPFGPIFGRSLPTDVAMTVM